jgi:hypothetical protein
MFGAIVAGVGGLLAWFDFAGVSTGAFDVPAAYLFDYQTTSSDTISIGLVVVLLAAGALVAALVPGFGARRTTVRILGGGLLAVAVLFAIQLARTADGIGQSLTDLIGIGTIVTAVGAVGVLSGR